MPRHLAAILTTMLGLGLVIYVYRREGRSRGVKILLGALRTALVLLVIVLLNRGNVESFLFVAAKNL